MAGTRPAGGSGNGGGGGRIAIVAEDGDVMAGAVDTSGGAGGDNLTGGDAGDLILRAGFAENAAAGALRLTDTLRAVDGEGGPDIPGDSGVEIFARGDFEFAGVGPQVITTTEGLTLEAGNGIGVDGTPLLTAIRGRLSAGVTGTGGIHIRNEVDMPPLGSSVVSGDIELQPGPFSVRPGRGRRRHRRRQRGR